MFFYEILGWILSELANTFKYSSDEIMNLHEPKIRKGDTDLHI